MRTFALKDKHEGKIQSAGHAKFKPPFAGQSNEVRSSHDSNIQPRLKINIPGDIYEREADGIADKVMAMPEPGLRRAALAGAHGCTKCPAEQAGELRQLVQRSGNETNDVADAAAPFTVPDVLRSPGQPLDAMARSFFEPRFGCNFNQVRVHTDPHAAEVSQALNARAFTVGDDVFFGAGEYRPGNSGGRRLIAHELAHTVQQARNAVKIQRSNGAPGVSHFSVYNPGDFHWPLLSANRQPEMRAYTAGSIIRGTRYGDYDGWTSVTASFEFEVEEAGARVDVNAGAEVKGIHRSASAPMPAARTRASTAGRALALSA